MMIDVGSLDLKGKGALALLHPHSTNQPLVKALNSVAALSNCIAIPRFDLGSFIRCQVQSPDNHYKLGVPDLSWIFSRLPGAHACLLNHHTNHCTSILQHN